METKEQEAKEAWREHLAIELLSRFHGNSRGLPIEKRGFIAGYKCAIEREKANIDEIHNKIMTQWEKDFGSIHSEQTMDAYTVSGFILSLVKTVTPKKK